MRAIEISEFGDPEVLKLCERPDPVAAEGEVLIRVMAAGINRPDVMQRRGMYQPPEGVTDLPGLEVAGVIEQAAGEFKTGDKVCALVAGGGYADLVAAPLGQVLPMPEGFSYIEAAVLPETFFTVWHNLYQRARLQSGETLLVHGGSSGIGTTAIQMAKSLGSKVIVTVGNQAKADACLALGADHALIYKDCEFEKEVKTLTGGTGANVILDMVAGPYVSRNLRCLATEGRIAIIALMGGRNAELDLGRMLVKRQTIGASTLRPQSLAAKAEMAQGLRETVWPLLVTREIKPVIDTVYDLGEAAEAHERMESSQHIGKLVLVP